MSELSIKIVIAGRTYPLTIKREEEEVIRKAAKEINDAVKVLQENYAVKDSQDLVSMAALQIATKSVLEESPIDYSEINSELIKLSSKLDEHLSE